MSNILSLQAAGGPSIWDILRAEIERVVRADVASGAGKKKLEEMLLSGDTPAYLIEEAVSQIYADVAEFYYWYFDDAHDKAADLRIHPHAGPTPEGLKNAVKAVVEDNLAEMRLPPSNIPPGLDSPDLGDVVTDKLAGYILNWEDWFWDNYEIEVIEDFYELKAINDEIYREDAYGAMSNEDEAFWDDVPYISKELGLND